MPGDRHNACAKRMGKKEKKMIREIVDNNLSDRRAQISMK